MNYAKRFRVKPGASVDLGSLDPGLTDRDETARTASATLERHARRLDALQYLLFAERKRSVLVCLQGLDAAGKDGTIRHVMGSMGPEGIRAHSFKVPNPNEASHDFLWRVHRETPAAGEIVIFNRSHYEDILVPRVHGTVPRKVWEARYAHINAFEAGLRAAGTHVLKLFLHMSPGEQLRRFEKRLDDPMRRWKIAEADYTERARWPAYIEAYEDVLERTSTEYAPWYVIPADHKWFRNLAVSTILVEALESLDLKAPSPTVDLAKIRREYHSAVQATGGHRRSRRKSS